MQSSRPDDPQRPNSPGDTAIIDAIDVDPDEFVAAVEPVLAQRNPQQLLEFLKSRWNKQQFLSLVRGPHEDARKVAALCLSLVGTVNCIPEITNLLKDPCPCVNEVAEHALWSIWFRAGSDEANHNLARGAQAIERRDILHAIHHFDRAIQLSPDFAEAYHQRAIARFLLEEFTSSLKDCTEATKRMPCHFDAWANTGHNYAHLGDVEHAIEAYEMALSINPHMQTVRETINQLRAKSQS